MGSAEFVWWASQYASSLYRCRAKWGRITLRQILHSNKVPEPWILQLCGEVTAVVCVLLYFSLYNKRAMRMRQGISDFKEVRKVSEKSWGTNGLTPTPPPVGCCLNPGVFWELSPSVGSQRQFFQPRSHQFLSEGSPSNVLPFCCAVTCVIPQFIALWAGSFYHERFLSVSFTLPLLLPRSHSLSLSSLFCSVCCCWTLMARSQHWHNVVTIHKTDYLPPTIHNVLKPISVNSLN